MNSGIRDADFEAALGGTMTVLQRCDGTSVPLPAHRWHADAEQHDRWLLDRCAGATIDLGCGPGRLVRALVARGVHALGVDIAAGALAACTRNGAPVLRRDLFGPLPHEGAWSRVLLADGNIGIGGDPVALLRRTTMLLVDGGTILVELAGPGEHSWTGFARLTDGERGGPWFPWAVVGADSIAAVAAEAGLRVCELTHNLGRWFAELTADGGRAG
ncbi:class I SAM-dependent methyltransferase [Sciscionella marina]|uniref:methionine biosynthesis protein MetW n=1 Tax=Sciscionella marina TaxID=508770 RepID=UPI00035F1057|nr:class I SAM-dependent methyltransferase [Sciscionella marina]